MKRFALIASLCVLAPLTACNRGPTPTPTPEPTEEVASPAGELRVVKPVVNYRATEQDDLEEIEAGSSLEVPVGGNLVVSSGGRAELVWPSFFESELLDGTDLLISLSDPATRRSILDQAAGTARYRLLGPDEAAAVTLQAGWVQLLLEEGRTDAIVSFIPGNPASVWVAVIEGEVEVRRGTMNETPEPETTEVVTISAGDVAAFTENDDLPAPMPVGRAVVEDWYLSLASGAAEGSIASVALWCEVVTGGPLALEPEGEPAEAEVATGDRVLVVQRDGDAAWARVATAADEDPLGWLMADSLRCLGPLSAASTEGDDEAPVSTEATATATTVATVVRGPTFTPTSTFTPGPTRTVTPTPTPTVGGHSVNFSVDDENIDEGECTTLRWNVTGVREVRVSGFGGVAGEGQAREICPTKTTEYVLTVILLDGKEETHRVTVNVRPRQVEPTATPTTELSLPTNTPPPAPTNTEEPAPQPSDTPQPDVTTVAEP